MQITFTDEQDDPLPRQPLIDVATVALQAEALPPDTQLSLALVDPSRMAQLNATYMDKEGPTDVLSFPIEDLSTGFGERDEGGPPLLLGDIVICPAVVRSNAAAAGVAFEDEMALMVVIT